MKYRFLSVLFLVFPLVAFAESTGLEIVPRTFDFGWAPANAKVTASFTLRNTSIRLIPITDVQPSCGCTAPDFTAGDLASQDEMTIGLTFDTRGYQGIRFFKKTYVKTGDADWEYEVFLRGHVLDPAAPLRPAGSGVVTFEPGMKDSKKTVSLVNHSSETLSLSVVQRPAEWAEIRFDPPLVQSGKSSTLTVTVLPPYDDDRHTSVTFEGADDQDAYRATVAIRTGPSPQSSPSLPPAP